MFYSNHAVYCVCPSDGYGLFLKGKYTYYDSVSGKITAQGIEKPYLGKTGKWKIYENGKYVRTDSYCCGFLKDSLRDNIGRRILVYFTYGFGSGWQYNCKEKAFSIRYAPYAGCLVSNGMKRRMAIHNFFNNVRQVLRFGWNWREHYESYECQDE